MSAYPGHTLDSFVFGRSIHVLTVAGNAPPPPPLIPFPDSETVCGFPGAVSFIVSVPGTAPVAVGENVTFTVQLLFVASVAGQLFVWLYCAVTETPLMANGPPPVFEMVTDSGELLVPVVVSGKLM